MCWRFAGSVCLSLYVFLFFDSASHAQDLPPFIVSLIEQHSEEGGDAEELVQYYESLALEPLNINAASRARLEETGLLSLFQLESLLSWRERYGAVRSYAEWALVEGFSPEIVAQLRPFFALGEPASASHTTQTYTARFKKKWRQPGFSLTSKAVYDAGDFSAGAVVDNDPKERFPDFISLSGRYKGFFAGDFTARFGQGLVMWKGFSMSGFSSPSAVFRQQNGLREYRSSDESDFFRGAGWSGSAGKIGISVFASYNALDANIKDGAYTSIVRDGLHVSESELAKRHSMHETVLGGNVSVELEGWHIGFTAAAYSYDKRNGRRVQDYNRFQQYDGWWGNAGIDVRGYYRSLRLFAEAAVDAHLAPAVIAGAVWSPSYNFETGLSLRCYSPSYIATHSAAHSTSSSVSNQIGALWSTRVVHKAWKAQVDAEYVYYPWKRYRAEAGTMQFKGRILLTREFRSGALLQGQLSWNALARARVGLELPFAGQWHLSVKAEGGLRGAAAYAGLRWQPGRHWDVSARVTLWRTDGWESRIYFYERGVPQSFSVEPYYGKGIGEYAVVKYSPNRNLEFWLKLQQGYCAYFVRIFIPGRMTLFALRPLSL